jgi:beta-1,4-mannosyl-glycoprotein beta-1,4-N-acetylglucosaminyltransferase
MKIYDCFNFFNELDILELRFNILNDFVDHFVIVESNVTHSGDSKPFYYEENKDRFSKFNHKVIHYKVFDTPVNFVNLPDTQDVEVKRIHSFIESQTNRFNRITQTDYGRDFYQKECVRRALVDCKDSDVIIISDADEIPDPELLLDLEFLDLDNKIYSFNQNMYCYFFNMLKETGWRGSKMGTYRNLKNLSFNEVRGDTSLTQLLPAGGWHFSFFGGEEMVRKKITSYSARDLANQHVLNNVRNNINEGIDVFFRQRLQKVEIDESYPDIIRDNVDKYSKFIKK